MTVIDRVRNKRPLIHHLTNQVVMNFTANGLLAFGASPIMAKEVTEVEEIAALADGVLINIGTLLERDIEALLLAGKTANEHDIPVVLDPVGVAATRFRLQAVKQLTEAITFTAMKGNAGEMATLVDIPWQTKGVESIDDDLEKLEEIAWQVAQTYQTIAVVTGETDVVSDGKQVYVNKHGHPLLTKITGAGCLLGSILTASLSVADDTVFAAYEAITYYGKAAERAASKANGPGSFQVYFLDELSK